MQYTVIKCRKLEELIREVNAMLSNGWVLQGGVAVSESRDQGSTVCVYAQAMVIHGV